MLVYELGATRSFRSTRVETRPALGWTSGRVAVGYTTGEAVVFSSIDRNGDCVSWRAQLREDYDFSALGQKFGCADFTSDSWEKWKLPENKRSKKPLSAEPTPL